MWYFIFGVAVVGLLVYLYSYYGWVRRWEGIYQGRGMYSLHYDRIRYRSIATALEKVHAPLLSMDGYRYRQLIDCGTPVPALPSDWMQNPPDFTVSTPTTLPTQPADHSGDRSQ